MAWTFYDSTGAIKRVTTYADAVPEVYKQPTQPTSTSAYIWIETNELGEPIGLWVGP